MNKQWFGKGCKYFYGFWVYSVEYEPEICFCNYPENKEETEGNCYKEICPGYKKK